MSIQAFAPRVLDPESLGQFPRLQTRVGSAARRWHDPSVTAIIRPAFQSDNRDVICGSLSIGRERESSLNSADSLRHEQFRPTTAARLLFDNDLDVASEKDEKPDETI